MRLIWEMCFRDILENTRKVARKEGTAQLAWKKCTHLCKNGMLKMSLLLLIVLVNLFRGDFKTS